MCSGEPIVKFDNNESKDELALQLLSKLSSIDDLILVLKFCKTLTDELRSASLTDVKSASVEGVLLDNLKYFIQLITTSFKGLQNSNLNDDNIVELLTQTLETSGGWIDHFSKVSDANRQLKQFVPVFLDYLEISFKNEQETIFLSTIDLIAEMYIASKGVWDRSSKQRLYQFILTSGSIITSSLEQGQNENNHQEYDPLDDKNVSFCRLLISFTESLTVDYLENPHNDSSTSFKQLLQYCISFSNLSAIPIVEDNMAMEVLEFWNNFVEEIITSTLSTPQPQTNYIANIIDIYWHRIMLPIESVQQSWTTDNWQEFLTFRRDFCDFLELAYPIVSTELFNLLVNSVMSNINNNRDNINWRQIECSLYCLNGLSDMIDTAGDEYRIVQSIFASSLWEDLSLCNNLRVRQTAVSLIGSFDGFFEQEEGRPYLSVTLSYLFKSLSISNLSLTASRSIQKLCASSRQHLTSLLPSFLDLYISRQYFTTTGMTAHERTVNAIACVVQALPNLEEKLHYVDKLLTILTQQLYLIIQKDTTTVEESDILSAISLLKCIVNIGKGLRVPDETAVHDKIQIEEIALFWKNYGSSIRDNLLHTIQTFTIDSEPFNKDSQICEVCCEIFKTGFSETIPNPFVFEPETVLTFLSAKHRFGPPTCYTSLIGLSSCLVTCTSMSSNIAPGYITTLLEIFFQTTTPKQPDQYEPDIQVGNLQLLTQIFTHYPQSFLSTPTGLSFMLVFATEMVSSQDRFVIRAASKFWTTFLTKDKNEEEKHAKLQAIISIGQTIVQNLVNKISGEAPRSDLEYFTDMIKKLIAKHPLECKPWFTHSIITSPQPTLAQRDLTLRTRFLTKLFNVRGGRETNTIILNFWSECKGIINYT